MTVASVAPAGAVEHEFATSGSTGEPVRWLRTAAQIAAEARLLVELCAADGIDGVVSYAPRRHLYGHLLGVAVPDLLGVPYRPGSLAESPAAALSGLRRPLLAALPASFAHLARCHPALAGAERLLVVHSSAVLPPGADAVLAALPVPVRFVELFGSTETGLVATRTSPSDPEWTLAPDVDFAVTGGPAPGPLTIRSPRLARRPGESRPATRSLDDIVSVNGVRTFRWLGRRGELVKVNGRRVELDAVLARIGAAAPGVRLTAYRHPDPLRGEWFTVLADTGDPAVLAAVRHCCRQLPPWQQPRAVETTRIQEVS